MACAAEEELPRLQEGDGRAEASRHLLTAVARTDRFTMCPAMAADLLRPGVLDIRLRHSLVSKMKQDTRKVLPSLPFSFLPHGGGKRLLPLLLSPCERFMVSAALAYGSRAIFREAMRHITCNAGRGTNREGTQRLAAIKRHNSLL